MPWIDLQVAILLDQILDDNVRHSLSPSPHRP